MCSAFTSCALMYNVHVLHVPMYLLSSRSKAVERNSSISKHFDRQSTVNNWTERWYEGTWRKWKVQESMHIWFIACRFFICYPSTYVYQKILKHLTAYFITLHVSEPSIISSIRWRFLFKYNNDGSRSVFRVTLRLFKRRTFGTSKATIINNSKLNKEFLNG